MISEGTSVVGFKLFMDFFHNYKGKYCGDNLQLYMHGSKRF